MDPYSFLRTLDSRAPFQSSFNGLLNGLNPLATLSGLGPALNPDLVPADLLPPSFLPPNPPPDAPVDVRSKARIAREEASLEAKIVQAIALGNSDSLNPNTGKAVSVGEHQICVAFHDDHDSGYRIWEWHGHLLLFDDGEGYTPQYIYGNHFQPLDKASDRREALKASMKLEAAEHAGANGAAASAARGLGSIIDAFDAKLSGDDPSRHLLGSNILHRNNGKTDDLALASSSSSIRLAKK